MNTIDPAPSPIDHTHNKDLIRTIIKIISRLPIKYGQIFIDIAYYGMTYTECSKKYNVSCTCVRQRYFKTIRVIQYKSYLLI